MSIITIIIEYQKYLIREKNQYFNSSWKENYYNVILFLERMLSFNILYETLYIDHIRVRIIPREVVIVVENTSEP